MEMDCSNSSGKKLVKNEDLLKCAGTLRVIFGGTGNTHSQS
jgi:hypothetical protein